MIISSDGSYSLYRITVATCHGPRTANPSFGKWSWRAEASKHAHNVAYICLACLGRAQVSPSTCRKISQPCPAVQAIAVIDLQKPKSISMRSGSRMSNKKRQSGCGIGQLVCASSSNGWVFLELQKFPHVLCLLHEHITNTPLVWLAVVAHIAAWCVKEVLAWLQLCVLPPKNRKRWNGRVWSWDIFCHPLDERMASFMKTILEKWLWVLSQILHASQVWCFFSCFSTPVFWPCQCPSNSPGILGSALLQVDDDLRRTSNKTPKRLIWNFQRYIDTPPANSEVPVSTATRQPLHRFLGPKGFRCKKGTVTMPRLHCSLPDQCRSSRVFGNRWIRTKWLRLLVEVDIFDLHLTVKFNSVAPAFDQAFLETLYHTT